MVPSSAGRAVRLAVVLHRRAQGVAQGASAWCHDGRHRAMFMVVRSGLLMTVLRLDLP